MSLTKRSTLVLSQREHNVLIDLLKGLDVDESTEHLGISRTSVVHARRRLQRKFGAKSAAHMVVLAILEKKYFDVLNERLDRYNDELNAREVYIAQQILLGVRNKRIAEMSFLSVRTIEDYRESFYTKCRVNNICDFVKACLDNGILKMVPFEFEVSMEGGTFDTSTSRFQLMEKHGYTNPYGFVYFDYQNRFATFESENVPLYSHINISPFTLSLILSDVPFQMIEKITGLPHAFIETRCKQIEQQVIKYGGCMSFFLLLNKLNFFHPVIDPKKTVDISTLGKKVILDEIDKKPKQFCNRRWKFSIVNDRDRRFLKEQFNCTSDLTTIVQAIHLDMLQLSIST
ncbi:MAG: LuxR C-terminal-related transcriptional regulator [bacterium]|nr:LuxR C-terminal-related transcriptional regulator [bacterium]